MIRRDVSLSTPNLANHYTKLKMIIINWKYPQTAIGGDQQSHLMDDWRGNAASLNNKKEEAHTDESIVANVLFVHFFFSSSFINEFQLHEIPASPTISNFNTDSNLESIRLIEVARTHAVYSMRSFRVSLFRLQLWNNTVNQTIAC